jgi:hypothetical protein
MDIINEQSTAYVTVSFTDKTNAPAVPSTITYSTRSVTTGTAIKTGISVTPAASIEITLDALDTTIQNPANQYEDAMLTVHSTYGNNDNCNNEYPYRIKNLGGI